VRFESPRRRVWSLEERLKFCAKYAEKSRRAELIFPSSKLSPAAALEVEGR